MITNPVIIHESSITLADPQEGMSTRVSAGMLTFSPNADWRSIYPYLLLESFQAHGMFLRYLFLFVKTLLDVVLFSFPP